MKKQPRKYVTNTTDSIECPWCGDEFDGSEATGDNLSVINIECPSCGGRIEVLQSVQYTCSPIDENGDVITDG